MVGALVVTRLQKLDGYGVVARGNLEQVESGLFRALSRLHIHFDDGRDVGLIHRIAVDRPVANMFD